MENESVVDGIGYPDMLFRGNGAPFPFTQDKSVMAVKLSVGSFRA
jgi:hypothetical protein